MFLYLLCNALTSQSLCQCKTHKNTTLTQKKDYECNNDMHLTFNAKNISIKAQLGSHFCSRAEFCCKQPRIDVNIQSTPTKWAVRKGGGEGGASATLQALTDQMDYLLLATYYKERESTHVYSCN